MEDVNMKLTTIMKAILLTLIITAAFTSGVWAQTGMFSSANMGLGGGGTAYMDSYHANFINPANLMIKRERRPKISFGLVGVSATGGGSLVNIETYNNYLTSGNTITSSLASEMLNDWFGTDPDAFTSASLDFSVIPVGVAVRSMKWSMGVAVRNRAMANIDLTRGVAELLFHGLDPDIFENGRSINMRFETLSFSEISVGYARQILMVDNLLGIGKNAKLYVGIAPKLLLAHNTQRFDLNSTLTVRRASGDNLGSLEHDLRYTIQSVGEMAESLTRFYDDRIAAGEFPVLGDYIEPVEEDFTDVFSTGFGIDAGVTLELDINHWPLPNVLMFRGDKKLYFAVSITDFGKLMYDDRIAQFSASNFVEFDGFTIDRELIDNEFDGDQNAYFESVIYDSIGAEKYLSFSPDNISSFERELPTRINFGTHIQMGRIGVMMDIGTGLNERGINTQRMYMAFGTEYKFLNFIPLRVGMRTGGYSSTTYHAGAGLEFRNLEFSIGASSSTSSKEYGAGLGVAWSGLIFHF